MVKVNIIVCKAARGCGGGGEEQGEWGRMTEKRREKWNDISKDTQGTMSQQGNERTSVLFQLSTFSTSSLSQYASFVVKTLKREKKKQEKEILQEL